MPTRWGWRPSRSRCGRAVLDSLDVAQRPQLLDLLGRGFGGADVASLLAGEVFLEEAGESSVDG